MCLWICKGFKRKTPKEIGIAIITDYNNIIDKEGKKVNTYFYSLKEKEGCFKVNC